MRLVDHDHRRGDRHGSWVGELYGCGEYRCGANGHDDHRRPDLHRHPGGRTATTTDLQQHDRSDEPVNRAAGGTGTAIAVTAGGTCAWTAVSNAPSWITITAGASGTGPGSVSFTVAANTGAARMGTMTIAGQTFTVDPGGRAATTTTELHLHDRSDEPVNRGCGRGRDRDRGHGRWHVRVDRRQQCPSWITITAGASGTGPGSVSFTVAANTGACANGHDDHRRPDVHRRPGGRAALSASAPPVQRHHALRVESRQLERDLKPEPRGARKRGMRVDIEHALVRLS